MYEYPKEILIFGRNINQPLTTANIGDYFIFDVASCREPARKMYSLTKEFEDWVHAVDPVNNV